MGHKFSAVNGVRSPNFYEPGNAVNEIWMGDLEIISRMPFGDSDMAQAGWPKGDWPKIPWRPFIIPLRAGIKAATKSRDLQSAASLPSLTWTKSFLKIPDVNVAVVCWLMMQFLAVPILLLPISLVYLSPGNVRKSTVVYTLTADDQDTRYNSPMMHKRNAFFHAVLGSAFYVLGLFLVFSYGVAIHITRGYVPWAKTPHISYLRPGIYFVYQVSSGILVFAAAYAVACLWDSYLETDTNFQGTMGIEDEECFSVTISKGDTATGCMTREFDQSINPEDDSDPGYILSYGSTLPWTSRGCN